MARAFRLSMGHCALLMLLLASTAPTRNAQESSGACFLFVCALRRESTSRGVLHCDQAERNK